MTTFGPLDEAVLTSDSEYGGGPGLVQIPPGGKLLSAGDKLGITTRAGKQAERTKGAVWKITTAADGTVTSELNKDDAVDPVTGISVEEARQDGPVQPK